MTPEFCICICTYRRPELLFTLLRDLSQQTILPSVLIVVDGDPNSGKVLDVLQNTPLTDVVRIVYIPSNHANIAFQRYLGWRKAAQLQLPLLIYLDDDLRIEQMDALANVIHPFQTQSNIVGVTAYIKGFQMSHECDIGHILQNRRVERGRIAASIVHLFGSRIPPGGLSPSGHRRVPPIQDAYYPVEWLFGCVMAFSMSALTQECFSDDQFAMTYIGCGTGLDDTLLSHRASSRGKMLLAWNAIFLHPDNVRPVAYPTAPFRHAYGAAYSRRVLNDNYRWPYSPRLSDRLALLRSYLGNIILSWGNVLLHPARHRFEYALGYTLGAIRGIIQPPSARRLTPHIDWWQDAEEALKNVIEIGAGT